MEKGLSRFGRGNYAQLESQEPRRQRCFSRSHTAGRDKWGFIQWNPWILWGSRSQGCSGPAGKSAGASLGASPASPLVTGWILGAAERMNNSSSSPAPERRDLCRSSRGIKAPAGSGEGPRRSRPPDPFPISRALERVPRLHTRPCSLRSPFQAGEISPSFSQGFGHTELPRDGFWGSIPTKMEERLGLGRRCFGCTTPPVLQNPVFNRNILIPPSSSVLHFPTQSDNIPNIPLKPWVDLCSQQG